MGYDWYFGSKPSIIIHGIPKGSGEDSPSFFNVIFISQYFKEDPLHEQENTEGYRC